MSLQTTRGAVAAQLGKPARPRLAGELGMFSFQRTFVFFLNSSLSLFRNLAGVSHPPLSTNPQVCLCGSAGFLPAPRPRAHTASRERVERSAHPGLGCPGVPRALSIPRLQRTAPWLRAGVWRREESCKALRGVGRSEEGRRKGRTRLSSRGDRGVPRSLSPAHHRS